MSYAEEIKKNNVEVNYLVHYTMSEDCAVGSGSPNELVFFGSALSYGGSFIYRAYWNQTFPRLITFYFDNFDNGQPNFEKAFPAAHWTDPEMFQGSRFYFDQEQGVLYFRIDPASKLDNTGPDITTKTIIDYGPYLSTKDVVWHVDPTNEASPKVLYRGLLSDIPRFSATSSQVFYGFSPTETLSMRVRNDGLFDETIFQRSVANSTVNIYRVVGDFDPENAVLCFSGFSKSLNFDGPDVNLTFNDLTAPLDGGASFVLTDTTLDVSPDFKDTNLKSFVCGQFGRQFALCVSYDDPPATNNNRSWIGGIPYYGPIFYAFNSSHSGFRLVFTTDNSMVGSNTTTRTYLDSVDGAKVGQWVTVFRTGGPDYRTLTTVFDGGAGNRYVEFSSAIGSAQGTSDSIAYYGIMGMQFIRKADLVDVGINPDYSIASMGNSFGSPQWTFKNNFESVISLSPPINQDDYHIMMTYDIGALLNFANTGSKLGASQGVINKNPIQALYEILYWAGFGHYEQYYDIQSWQDTANALNTKISVCTPRKFTDQTQTFRDVVAKICETFMIKLYVKNGKWHVSLIEPMGDPDYTVTRDDVIGDPSYRVVTDDLYAGAIAKYNFGDFNFSNENTGDSWQQKSRVDYDLSQKYNSKKTRTIETYIAEETDVETWRDRYIYALSAPAGYLKMTLTLAFIGIKQSDIIEIDPTDFPDLPFSSPKKFSVISITENMDSIDVELFDQRGIEEHSGDW